MKSDQEKACESKNLSDNLPEFGRKLIDKSQIIAEDIHWNDSLDPIKRASIAKKIYEFRFTELCMNKENLEGLEQEITQSLKRVEYLKRGKDSSSITECLNLEKPDRYWEDLRLKEARSLCKKFKRILSPFSDSKSKFDCDRKDLSVIDFKYMDQIYTKQSPRQQCLFLMKQLNSVLKTIESR
jgi:hypothetical protein